MGVALTEGDAEFLVRVVKKSPAQKDADFIRRLATGFDGEIVATVYAWRRKLSSNGRDLNDVAEIVEGGGKLNEAEMQRLYDAGYKPGCKRVKAVIRLPPAASTAATFTTWRSGRGNAPTDWRADTAISSATWSS